MIEGTSRLEIMGVVDSGASITYVTKDVRKRAGLEPTGDSQRFLCVHGKNHAGIETKSYRGVVTLGTVYGNGTVYELDARPTVGGLRVGAVLGRDMLHSFNVALNWKDRTGFLAA